MYHLLIHACFGLLMEPVLVLSEAMPLWASVVLRRKQITDRLIDEVPGMTHWFAVAIDADGQVIEEWAFDDYPPSQSRLDQPGEPFVRLHPDRPIPA